jgi:hypothetical protein
VKKIRISANWDTSENITERLLKQFKTPEIDLTKIQFVYDDSYDIIVFFNHVCSDFHMNQVGMVHIRKILMMVQLFLVLKMIYIMVIV